jgi:hypothetical protein
MDTWGNQIWPTIQGEYLNPQSNQALGLYANAAIDPIISTYLQDILPTWDNQAVASGRYGSGFWQEGKNQASEDMMKSLGLTTASIYAPAYESERERQMFASQLPLEKYKFDVGAQMDALDSQRALLEQGFQQAGYLSAEINAEMQRWMDQIYGPLDYANMLANLFMSGGALGRTSTTTSPYMGPTFAQSLLGGGLSAAALYNMFA